jgi:hypothetical protein
MNAAHLRLAGMVGAGAAFCTLAGSAHAQESDADLAKKLNNPVASLTSVPFQFNHDCCFGPQKGARETLNIQPVIPFSLNTEWNLIVRTILPVIHQDRISPTAGSSVGLGDTLQSFFFSPKTTSNGVTWAIGPAFLWPTGSDEFGSKKWGAGPTALILKQESGWTYGVLANHIWSYANVGDRRGPEVNQTFVQPFLSYTNARHTTLGINTESTYNWKTGAWTIPINMTVAHLYRFGKQPVQLTGGVRFDAAHENQGPDWGLRFVATFLFPK